MNRYRSPVSASAATTIATAIHTRGSAPPHPPEPSISDGTPTSMPIPTRNGPASQAAFWPRIGTSRPHSVRR